MGWDFGRICVFFDELDRILELTDITTLGHAFYLPHPPGCDEQLSTCDLDALMYLGYTNYPNTYLRADERSVLVQSPFFGPRGVAAPFDCN